MTKKVDVEYDAQKYQCEFCKYYRGEVKGCVRNICCYDDISANSPTRKYIKRKKGRNK